MISKLNENARIMLVDDTLKNIQLLGTLLSRSGYQIYIAQSGTEALKISEKVKLDMILLDIMMPGMNGFEVCQVLKGNPKTKDIPVIFLTARTETEDIVTGFEAGAVDYVTKPFNSAELLARVRTHLDIRRKEKKILQLSKAVEQSPVAIVITDLKGNIQYVNPRFCDVSGYSSEEVLGKNSSILKSGEKSLNDYKSLWETLNAGKEWRGEFKNCHKSGEFYWVSVSISPIKDENGDFHQFMAIQEDITEKKVTEEKLKESYQTIQSQNELLAQQNMERKEFIHILCHDLLNPIGNIKSVVQLITEFPDCGPDLMEALVISSDVAMETINLVRNYMAIESGKKTVTLESVNLKELVDKAVELLKLRFQKKEIALEVDVPSDLFVFVEKVSFVSSVLSNLLTNALKFSYRNSRVEVIACKSGNGMVQVCIKDHGIGIPEKLLSDIFKINKVTSRSGTEEEVGTGFGMPLVKKYIDFYGGNIQIHSKNESSQEKGTEVILTLKTEE